MVSTNREVQDYVSPLSPVTLGHTFTLKRLSFLIYRMSGDSRLGVH